MSRSTVVLSLAMVTLSAATLGAQATDSAAPVDSYTQSQPAPIQRSASPQSPNRSAGSAYTPAYTTALAAGQVLTPTNGTASVQPVPGLYLRVAANSSVRAITVSPQRTELKVERGLVNLSVHDPAKDMLIVIDLPGGQVQPYKNGFYTFNAATGTARTLVGEADVFALNAAADAKPVKPKEDHSITFPPATGATQAQLRTHDFYPYEARTDVIAAPYADRHGDGPAYGAYYGYPYYAYDGFYGYGYPYHPYYAFDSPCGPWGYPYGFGIGFGYYGGYYGGFRGGFRR